MQVTDKTAASETTQLKTKEPLHKDRRVQAILDSYIMTLVRMSGNDRSDLSERDVYLSKRNLKQVIADGKEIASIGGVGFNPPWIGSETLMRRVIGEVSNELKKGQRPNLIREDMKGLKAVWDSVLMGLVPDD